MSAELTGLFKHNLWANIRLLDECEKLSDEHLDTTVAGTYGSIRDTLVHIASGEELYVHMMLGQPRPPRREYEGFTSFDQLRDLLKGTGEELIKLSQNNVIPASYQDIPDNEELTGGMVVILAINHATEHRAHINSILSHLGLEPVEVDGWAYGYTHGLITAIQPAQQ